MAIYPYGCVDAVTQIFFSGEDKPISFYLFRPLLGAVVAIGVYVITKAGVSVASSLPAQPDGGTQLNAFFISFVSLVAGLMSEAAISTIENAGTRLFRGDSVIEKARYARNVNKIMADKGKNATDLYPYFDVENQVVDDWLAESELVPAGAQRVIAAWLGESVRDLFSDLKSA